ncbi:MAG TPA: helix-turn-helix transcriptional regulator [Bdellovibrionales bacterium]|nr:helix-turn-helix transcriptional regulator [Bdellovibrionales bacterium]
MENYGVILRKLRELKRLPIKQAAKHIGRSAGWLSEVENGRGYAKLRPAEFERIVAAYDGEAYRKQFGLWIAKSKGPSPLSSENINTTGAILKYLRKKTKMTLAQVGQEVGLSGRTISAMELGKRNIRPELKDQLTRLYGYSPASFKNFTTEDKRAKNIPARYKLDMLIHRLDPVHIEQIYAFALQSANTNTTK